MRVLIITSILFSLPSPLQAATWFVPFQCPTIQAGIDSASAGDVVMVACGTYHEHDIVMKAGIRLRSQTWEPGCTVIDALHAGRAMFCPSMDSTTVIEAITFTGGDAGSGGGMYCDAGCSVTVIDCVFEDNSATWGGGVTCWENSSPTFTGCSFSANHAAHQGGGLYGRKSSVVVSQCHFSYNTSDEYGAGMFFYEHPCAQVSNCTFNDNSCEIWGGGLCCFASSPTVTECTFSENSAGYGGGMTCFTGSHPSLTDCVFRLNQGAYEGGGICCAGGSSPTLARVGLYGNWASVGGGLFCKTGAAPPLSGCTFSENSATTGGGTYISGASPTITACTYCGNTAACGAGIVCDGFSSPRLVNTVIAYSPQGEAVYCADPHHSHPLLTCCDLYANTGGDWAGCIENQLDDRGNLCADPLFCDASSRDYSLQMESPCAPFTPPNPECDLIGAWPVGCQGTAVAEQDPMSWSGLKALYR